MIELISGGAATLVVVAVQLAGAVVVGDRLLSWRGPRFVGPLDRVLVGLALGLAVEAALFLALAAGGLLSLPTLVTVSVLLPALLLGVPRGHGAATGLHGELIRYRTVPGSAWLMWVVCLWVVVVLLRSQAPEWNWDSLTYHLQVPQLFLEEGRIFRPPDILHVAFVGLFHMHYLLPLSLGLDGGAVVLNGFVMVAMALAVGQALHVRGSRRGVSLLAAATILGSTLPLLVAASPMVDTTTAFFGFLAVDHVLRLVEEQPSTRRTVVAGALAGVAVGVKAHGMVIAGLGLMVCGLWLIARDGNWKQPMLAALVALATASPWLLKNLILVGDPLYPLLLGATIDPWLRALPDVGAALSRGELIVAGRPAVVAARDPFTFQAFLFRPGSLSPDLEAPLSVLSPALLAGTVLLLVRWRAMKRAWPWLVIALLYCALLLGRSPYVVLRYLIPVFPLFAVSAAIGLDWLWRDESAEGAGWRTIRRGAIIGASVPVLLVLAVLPVISVRSIKDAEPGQLYSSEAMEGPTLVARHVPPGDTVLLISEARGLAFEGPVRQDNLSNTWPILLSAGYADRCLSGTGLQYLLIHWPRIRGLTATVGELYGVTDGALEAFEERCLIPLDSAGGKILYRIKPPSAASPRPRPEDAPQ